MIKSSIIFTAFLAMLYITLSSDIDGAAHHGHGNITGSANGTTGRCQTSSCHGGNNPLTIAALQVLDSSTMMPISTYNPLQTYVVSISGNDTAVTTNLPGFGFMASAVLANHSQSGTFSIPSSLASNIHTYPCGAQTIVEHTVVLRQTVTGINKYAIQFYWTAPAAGSDSTMFFSLLNAVNGNGANSGDYPNAAPKVTIYENPTASVNAVNSAENEFVVYPNPASNSSNISYKLPGVEKVSVAVYDIRGKVVAQLAENELQNSGNHQYQTDIIVPGLYFVHLVCGEDIKTLRFVKL